jgi:hypothetical protein
MEDETLLQKVVVGVIVVVIVAYIYKLIES